MSVDLLSGWTGHARFRNGYSCSVSVEGDQDRAGAFYVSTKNKCFGLFRRDGSSYWDNAPGFESKDGMMSPDQEIVGFEPIHERPADLIEHYEECMIGMGLDPSGNPIKKIA